MQNWHFTSRKAGLKVAGVSKGFVKCVMAIQIPVIQQNCLRVLKTENKR
jgi:hypothetical protein